MIRNTMTFGAGRVAVASLMLVLHTTSRADAQAAAGENALGQRFELQVVGPDGKPAANVEVAFRGSLAPVAAPIKVGELVTIGGNRSTVKTDAEGRIVVEIAKDQRRFVVEITHPGYGPYWAEWDGHNHPVTIPATFIAQLDAGWTVGGIVLDGDGVPVEGATVHPSIKFKKRPGEFSELHVGGDVVTDRAGKWAFHSVPESMREVHVSINHADFMPERRMFARREFGVEPGAEPEGQIELKRGVMVTGTVMDEAGNPIADAVIRSQFLNEDRETTTGPDGVYFLAGCEPRMTRIVVRAKGRALEMKEVRVEPGMGPVDFALPPGGKIRVRVVDEEDRPIARARIFFQEWRGSIHYFEFDHVNQYTGPNGVWEWNEAPVDEFKADICPPEAMQLEEQLLKAREEEYVFRRVPLLVVSGTVVDAETKEPIERFRVVPGMRWSNSQLFWSQHESFDAADGRYEVSRNRSGSGHLVRIEADGYTPAASRDIKFDEGNVTIDFELEKGRNIEATIVTPEGKPAAGAKVGVGVAGSQISIRNGDIDDGSTYAARQDADDEGRFNVPPQEGPFQVVVTHPAGFAYLKSEDGAIAESIQLTAWARVEGTFRVGAKAMPNVTLNINNEQVHSYGAERPNIFTHHETATAGDGSFVFERVFPGKGRIGRRIVFMVRQGATEVTSSAQVPIELPAGETTRLNLGGDGRAVIGRLAPPAENTGEVRWNFANLSVRADHKMPPFPDVPQELRDDPERLKAWREEWLAGDEGTAWQKAREVLDKLREASPYFSASVAGDGAFRIDDVPLGDYALSVNFHENSPGRLGNHRFTVPAGDDGDSSEPVNLGILTLEKAEN